MRKMFIWLKVILALSPSSIFRNIIYRLKLKVGLISKLTPIGQVIIGPLFIGVLDEKSTLQIDDKIKWNIIKEANALVQGEFKLFFHEKYYAGIPPRWFYHQEDIFYGHWAASPVNKYTNKDIKLTWDLSRFHWIQQLACAYKVTNNCIYLDTINSWFEEWNKSNSVNNGVNWACGQECAIRVIHVLNSTLILDKVQINSKVLIEFVLAHCSRIEPTIDYAISQDNNHATSEAAALFICGSWLLTQPSLSLKNKNLAIQWAKKGRKIIEERVLKLILNDGGFCMYSTNYHRVVLNTLSIVELWKTKLSLENFSDAYIKKCCLATYWLYYLVDEKSGNTLNLGANDGSNPFIIQSADFRDFRPSVQMAAILFLRKKLYDHSSLIDEPLGWLSIETSNHTLLGISSKSLLLPDSGIVKIMSANLKSVGFIKYPNYLFRPSQADLLHFDLWYEGENILRDSGSFSYNCSPKIFDYFASIKAHNSIEIDCMEPMPKLGKFLFGSWPKTYGMNYLEGGGDNTQWQGGYITYALSTHTRHVKIVPNGWEIKDVVGGAKSIIKLRWRLKPGNWILNGNNLFCDNIHLNIIANCKAKIILTNGYESLYYNDKKMIPVLEISIKSFSAIIYTNIFFKGE